MERYDTSVSLRTSMKKYFAKLKGSSLPPPKAGWKEALGAIVGSSIAISLIGLLHHFYVTATGLPLLIAPFGASAALVFGAYRSPLAQPRNVIGGHIISALAGITVYQLTGGGNEILGLSLAIPLAIGLMLLTGTLHPPGGATAFITVAGGEAIHSLGYWYVLSPCLAGSVLMILIALCINNISPQQKYPIFW